MAASAEDREVNVSDKYYLKARNFIRTTWCSFSRGPNAY